MRLALFVIAIAAFAQDDLTPAEKQFQDSMVNVKLVGHYTLGDSAELHEDSYVIEKVAKIGGDLWKFYASINYNNKPFKAALNLPVKFAGDTPVISLTDSMIPGFGKFTARVVLYNGTYAGTWSSSGGKVTHAGTLFGKIVKNEPPAQ